MLHKIGINKCTQKQLKYFQILTPTTCIDFEAPLNDKINIVSCMINSEILEIKIQELTPHTQGSIIDINQAAYLSFSIKLIYKVFYTTDTAAYMNVSESYSMHVSQIKIPYYLDGVAVKQLINQKKTKLDIFIEEVDIKKITQQSLMINTYVIANFSYLPQPSLGYIMSYEEGQNNVFLSYPNGKKLEQKTFANHAVHSQLIWGLYNQQIAYIDSNKRKCVGIINIVMNKIENLNMKIAIDRINDMCFVGYDSIVISCSKNTETSLYLINIKSGEVNKITNCMKEEKHHNVHYCIKTHEVFFIKDKQAETVICSLNLDSLQVREIYKLEYQIKMDISYDGAYIIIASENKEVEAKLILVNVETGYGEVVDLLYEVEAIKKVCFSPRTMEVAVLTELSSGVALMGYAVQKKMLKLWIECQEQRQISDFCFNALGDEVYYSANTRGKYDVYRLDLNNLENELITICDAEDIQMSYKIL